MNKILKHFKNFLSKQGLVITMIFFSSTCFSQKYRSIGFKDSLRYEIRNHCDSVWYIDSYSDMVSKYDQFIIAFKGDSTLLYLDEHCFEQVYISKKVFYKFKGLLLVEKNKYEIRKVLADYYKVSRLYNSKRSSDKKSFTVFELGKITGLFLPCRLEDDKFYLDFKFIVKQEVCNEYSSKTDCKFINPSNLKVSK